MLTTKTSGKVIGSLTQSWRYLLFLSLLPYLSTWPVFSLHFHNKLAFFVASVLFLLTQYSLFRLWLDSHLFKLYIAIKMMLALIKASLHYFLNTPKTNNGSSLARNEAPILFCNNWHFNSMDMEPSYSLYYPF